MFIFRATLKIKIKRHHPSKNKTWLDTGLVLVLLMHNCYFMLSIKNMLLAALWLVSPEKNKFLVFYGRKNDDVNVIILRLGVDCSVHS